MKKVILFLAFFLLTCQAQAQNTISFSGTIASISSSDSGYQLISSAGAGGTKKFLAYTITFQNANSTLQLRCMGFEHCLGVSFRNGNDAISFVPGKSYTFTLTPCCVGHKSFYGVPNFYSVFAIPQSSDCSLIVLDPNLKSFQYNLLPDKQPYVEYQGKLYRIDVTDSDQLGDWERLHFGD